MSDYERIIRTVEDAVRWCQEQRVAIDITDGVWEIDWCGGPSREGIRLFGSGASIVDAVKATQRKIRDAARKDGAP